MKPGPRNLITDVGGIARRQCRRRARSSPASPSWSCDKPAVAAVQVLGGAPGTRETDLLEPHNTVQTIDAVVPFRRLGLRPRCGFRRAGGAARTGPRLCRRAASACRSSRPRSSSTSPMAATRIGAAIRPIANSAMRRRRLPQPTSATGTAGAGTGATTADLQGRARLGLDACSTTGSPSARSSPSTRSAPPRSAISRHFWAAPFEDGRRVRRPRLPAGHSGRGAAIRTKLGAVADGPTNTTIAVIATDAVLTKAEAKRLAIAAHDGFARALWPAHTPLDGDLVFAVATGASRQGRHARGVRPSVRRRRRDHGARHRPRRL